MRKYDKYKPSGIEWIGEVPEHWEVKPFKHCVSINNGADYKHVVCEEDGYPVFGSGGPFAQASEYMYDGEVVFLGRKGTIDKPLYFNGKFWAIDTMFYAVPFGNTCGKFLYYMSLTFPFDYYLTDTARPSMTQTDLGDNMVAVPPLSEQTAIANYLDSKCSKIDNVVSVQQKRIELLKELKQSIITKAVTKGLDKNTKMKDSGIEWIGEVPEHWEVISTLYALSMPITDGPHESPKLHDNGIPFISAEAISGGEVDFDSMRGYISEEYYEECCRKYVPQLHDIYMIKSGATTGRTAIVKTTKKFTIWSPLAVFRANTQKVLPYYLLNVLRSGFYQTQVENSWSYGTQQNIGMRVLEKIKFPLPPLDEQMTILSELDKKCNLIDNQISKIERQMDLLKEYKQSVITDAVTGKFKVC